MNVETVTNQDRSDEADIWHAYNSLLLGPDIERIRKLLVRYELFTRTLEVPGDIVECGVFKGAGMLYWLKLLQIRASGSVKRVVGFDLFTEFPVDADEAATDAVRDFVSESGFAGVSTQQLSRVAEAAGFAADKYEFVSGDVRASAEQYVADRPGFRISLLHMDLDLGAPTLGALRAFWPRLTRGGIVVFDEYALGQWSESEGVDEFFADTDVQLRTMPWARTPTAYAVKEHA